MLNTVFSLDPVLIGQVAFEVDPLEEVIGGQMKYRYFPVNMGELASEIEHVRLTESPGTDPGNGLPVATSG